MDVTVRYFAMVRELMGRAAESRSVPEAITVGSLIDLLIEEEPRLASMRRATMVMVNEVYADPAKVLTEGDEVAFIPPVSGGAGPPRFWVQEEPLDPRAVEVLVEDRGTGALVTFVGRVRDQARGQEVEGLEYEAYPSAAARMMDQIGGEIRERWGIEQVAIAHRTGRLAVGEASVVIAVASAHRAAAFAACEYAIDRLKEIVPVWKKEHYAGGAVWIGSEAEYQQTRQG
ncbi:MAG: molybdopterin converting factor subunit 1 [Chloroflexia bacterium]|nr:molybdopterin converting factor subunit 1 [Chloroflexia bacterium]